MTGIGSTTATTKVRITFRPGLLSVNGGAEMNYLIVLLTIEEACPAKLQVITQPYLLSKQCEREL